MQLIKIVGLVISAIAIFPSVSLADTINGKDIQAKLPAQQESSLQRTKLNISLKDINPVKPESYYQTNNLTISLKDINNSDLQITGYNLNNTRPTNGVYNSNSFVNERVDGVRVKLFEVKFEF